MKKMITVAAALALLALSCGEEEGVTPQKPERLEPTSPVFVLKNVELAFNQRDINLLKAMLGPNFVFYFDPHDVGQYPPGKHYPIPESLSREEFLQAVSNMFRKAYSINLTISTGRVGTPGENETKYKAENVSLSLLVMIDSLNGYIADRGYCNFEFERYEAAGKKYWRLTGWWDRTSEGYDEYPGIAPSSLGRILAMYY